MAKFHFVKDYERHVAQLVATHPIDEAMSLAVGGSYTEVGRIEADILAYAGLSDGMSVFDLGCGSGRLGVGLAQRFNIRFTGTDVVQQLLDYARRKCPAHYQFKKHCELSIPMVDSSVDIASAFSVFTHLLHEETFIYLEDMRRVLRPGGKIVLSHVEFAAAHQWPVFAATVQQKKTAVRAPLNMFIECSAILVWARHLGLEVVETINGSLHPWGDQPLGQSIAILQRPMG